MKILLISMGSNPVFHEELEYAIGLMIRATNDDISSIFRYDSDFSFCKKCKNYKNAVKVFRLYLNENTIKF